MNSKSTDKLEEILSILCHTKKDGHLFGFGIFGEDIVFQKKDSISPETYTIDEYDKIIDSIESLYNETFVIESVSDTQKLVSGAKTVLKNGEILEFSNNDNGYLWFNFNEYESEIFPFIVLKGATVTQKRDK